MLNQIARNMGKEVHGNTFNSGEVLGTFNACGIRLGTKQYEVYTYLLGLANNNSGVCFPSQEALASKFEVTQQRISAIIKQLREKGLLMIELKHIQDKFHNFYILSGINQIKKCVQAIIDGFRNLSEIIVTFFKEVVNTKGAKNQNKSNIGYIKSKNFTRKSIEPTWLSNYSNDIKPDKPDNEDIESKRKVLEEKLEKYKKRGREIRE